MNTIPLGAYFYPLTTSCPIRKERAKEYGYKPVNETKFIKHATPRFQNHDLPHIYCLGEESITEWDDASPETMRTQIAIAQKFGIDFFIFDSYMGRRNGEFIHEMADPLNGAFLGIKNNKMKFALMIIPESPRVVIPVPKEFVEEGRVYDYDTETAKDIVDYCVKNYWNKENYLKIDGKPYLSFYMSQLSINPEKQAFLKILMRNILQYAKQKYDIEVYLVGVITNLESGKFFESAGARAITGYANLPDFDSHAQSVQDYNTQQIKRVKEWDDIQGAVKIPFVPPAVVGWDASPRGEPNLSLEEVKGIYPFTPIITGGSAKLFGSMLSESLRFILAHVPKAQQYGVICAWNEVSESMALLPTVKNGTIDFSYLDEVKESLKKIL